MAQKTYLPTRKWIATQVTALAAFLVAVVNAGEWNKVLTIALIGLISQAVVGYLIPNLGTSGGVPVKADPAPATAAAVAPAGQ